MPSHIRRNYSNTDKSVASKQVQQKENSDAIKEAYAQILNKTVKQSSNMAVILIVLAIILLGIFAYFFFHKSPPRGFF